MLTYLTKFLKRKHFIFEYILVYFELTMRSQMLHIPTQRILDKRLIIALFVKSIMVYNWDMKICHCNIGIPTYVYSIICKISMPYEKINTLKSIMKHGGGTDVPLTNSSLVYTVEMCKKMHIYIIVFTSMHEC